MIAKYKDGKPQINVHELPLVPAMAHERANDDWRMAEHYIDMLNMLGHEHTCAVWAIQMIAELEARWIDAVDRVRTIEKIINGLNREDDDR